MLEIGGLSKGFGQGDSRFWANRHLNLSVQEGSFLVLLGPSGCGKTTTLRCIAGLETPDEGLIRIDGKTVYSSDSGLFVPSEERPIGMVFQSYAIWPHMNVYQNVAFPLIHGVRRLPKKQVRPRVFEVLRLLQLEALHDRLVTTLSGGQQQRVAVARALALRPKLLLMDEPLSNLDVKLRERLRVEIKQITTEFRLTTVYVTHDQDEAMSMGDQVAILKDGEVLQLDTPYQLYHHPRNPYVAQFLGNANLIRGRAEWKGDDVQIATPAGNFSLPRQQTGDDKLVGDCLLGIRPECVEIVSSDKEGNCAKGMVTYRAFLGDSLLLKVRMGELEVQVKTPYLEVSQGENLILRFPEEKCMLFPLKEEQGYRAPSAVEIEEDSPHASNL